MPRFTALIPAIVLFANLPAHAADRPVTGAATVQWEPLDRAVQDFMNTIKCQAATVAVTRDDRLLFSRGYGWQDKNQKVPVPPDALFRLASVTKPFTMALVRNAVRTGRLSLDARAFDLVDVRPPSGKVADPRVLTVTVGQLLDHKGGWDLKKSFDPMFRHLDAEKALGLTNPPLPPQIIAWMLTQPLQSDPGKETAYSNFGYCVLGRVVERAYGKPYFDCVRDLCQPLGIRDIRLGYSDSKKRDPREVWYPIPDDTFRMEVMDAHGGLVASAPAVARFFEAFWVNGFPRHPGQSQNWWAFGSLPGTTALARQRTDGLNAVILMNGRRNDSFEKDNDQLVKALDAALDRVYKKKTAKP